MRNDREKIVNWYLVSPICGFYPVISYSNVYMFWCGILDFQVTSPILCTIVDNCLLLCEVKENEGYYTNCMVKMDIIRRQYVI